MFPFLLKQHLQDTREDEELDWVSLPKEDILRLQGDPNPPMFACQVPNPLLPYCETVYRLHDVVAVTTGHGTS